MAIALTRFQGLCGFRPVEEILGFLTCESYVVVRRLRCYIYRISYNSCSFIHTLSARVRAHQLSRSSVLSSDTRRQRSCSAAWEMQLRPARC